MTNRINRQSEAFKHALDTCRVFGLDWKKSILPKVENKEITGYHIVNKTGSTTIRTILV